MCADIRGDRAELRLTRGYVHLCHAPADRNGAKTVSLARLIQDMKARQSSKIRELGDALIAEGYLTLDEQARALALGRSTTWTILKRHYKTSGLSAGIINRMLAASRLPALVRARNPRIYRRKNRRVVRPQQHATKTICHPSGSQAGQPDPPERNEGGQGDRELEKQFNFNSSQRRVRRAEIKSSCGMPTLRAEAEMAEFLKPILLNSSGNSE